MLRTLTGLTKVMVEQNHMSMPAAAARSIMSAPALAPLRQLEPWMLGVTLCQPARRVGVFMAAGTCWERGVVKARACTGQGKRVHRGSKRRAELRHRAELRQRAKPRDKMHHAGLLPCV